MIFFTTRIQKRSEKVGRYQTVFYEIFEGISTPKLIEQNGVYSDIWVIEYSDTRICCLSKSIKELLFTLDFVSLTVDVFRRLVLLLLLFSCIVFLDFGSELATFWKSQSKYMRLKQINDLMDTSLLIYVHANERARRKERERKSGRLVIYVWRGTHCTCAPLYVCECYCGFFIHRKQLFLWQYFNVINEFYGMNYNNSKKQKKEEKTKNIIITWKRAYRMELNSKNISIIIIVDTP